VNSHPTLTHGFFFGVLYIVVVVKPYCSGTNLEVLDVTFLLAVCLSQSAWQNSGKKTEASVLTVPDAPSRKNGRLAAEMSC
jgi:hypothetical protein